jgi:signal transduction histidine kinase
LDKQLKKRPTSSILNTTAMESKSPEERIKPFRLVKYFTFTGLVVIFLVTVILSMFNTHWVKSMQRQKSEDYAHSLIENLNHQVFIQFWLPMLIKFKKIQLSNPEQFNRMDKVVRSTLHSFKVEALNIYTMDNTVAYSFDPDLIGRENVGGTGYQKALEGETTSRLVQQGNFFEISLGFPKIVRLITYAPLRAEPRWPASQESVGGVFEVVQDLSEDYQTIFNIQKLIVITCTVLMGSLFVVLIFVVKRGEEIIQKRAMERLRLKERLNRAERLSALGEMAAGISHEIRNPLGIIRSSAELLKKKVIKIDHTNNIPDIIIEESSRLNNIITDFINFARPRSPKLSPCRIEEVIEKNISFLSMQIKEKGYIIKQDYQNSLPEIQADADMLYQSFLNILINAMQAMPNGGTINVAISANEKIVVIDFEDEGQGIAEDVLEKIWDPFFTTKEMGTGLGLGVVKNIIESHGGSIQILNRAAGGAQVTVELPVDHAKGSASL